MPRQSTFRQLDERHLAYEVHLMNWSPKMDLIAIANVQGEVTLHRLSWQKVWVLAPPAKGVKVRALSWRPDGKVLAVGYSSGSVILCDTENKEILHSNDLLGPISLLHWVTEAKSLKDDDDDSYVSVFKDDANEFLPKLPPLSRTFSGIGRQTEEICEDSKNMGDRSSLNFLIIGTSDQTLYLYAFGIFPCLEYTLSVVDLGIVKQFHSVTISDDFSFLTMVVERDVDATAKRLQLVTYELPLLASRRRELHCLAVKYGLLSSLFAYMSSTIRSIIESWEDILLEIDSKLSNYAKEKAQRNSGAVSDDFLELLMFGTTTDELHKFLLHDLTEKGLKKLGHSIECSYTNIQKLVLKHLQSVGQAIFYHLTDMKGMSQWHERFGILGLSYERIGCALSAAGSLLLKTSELQQVIDSSMKNFKAFFRWLYVVISRLSDEQLVGEVNKITQQDLQFVARFLKDNFSETVSDHESGAPSFNLERVGQYLKNEDLSFPPNFAGNPWTSFLEKHPAMNDGTLLLPYPVKKSLVQQHEALEKEFNESLKLIAKHIGQGLFPAQVVPLAKWSDASVLPKAQQMFVNSTGHMFTMYSATNKPCEYLILMLESRIQPQAGWSELRAVKVYFKELGHGDESKTSDDVQGKAQSHLISDFQFYNEDLISVLLMEKQNSNVFVLAQVPIKNLISLNTSVVQRGHESQQCLADMHNIEAVDGGYGLLIGSLHRMENVRADSIAMSGTRHVACVTLASRHRVRLFEMDVEDEDEESSMLPDDMDTTNNSKENETLALGLLDCNERMDEDLDNDENKENCQDVSGIDAD